MPDARTYHSTVLYNGTIYVLGGYLYDPAASSLAYYATVVSSKIGSDGRLGEWAAQPGFAGGRSGAGAAAAAGCLFVSGGSSSEAGALKYFDDVQSARIAGDWSLSPWTASPNHMGTARSNHTLLAASTAAGLFLYAIAGVTQSGADTVHLDTVEFAKVGPDCAVGEWKAGNFHLKGGRSTPAALALHGDLAVFGGWGDLDSIDVFGDVQTSPIRPDGSVGPWRTSSRRLATGLYGDATVSIEPAGGSGVFLLLTLGGQPRPGAYANWIGYTYVFPGIDLPEAIGTWRIAPTGRLPSARAGLGAFEWRGRIYAVGGANGDGRGLGDVPSAEYDFGRP